MQRAPEIDEGEQEAPAAAPQPRAPGALRGTAPEGAAAPRRAHVQLVRSVAEHRLKQVIWLVVGVIDAVVGLDFVFRIIAASNSGVAHLIFIAGSWLSGPFDGIFASVPRISGLTLRWSDLLVAVLATAVGSQVVRVAGLSGSGRRQRVVERVLV
ncbi:MAG: hypothetical protein ACLQT7_05245 [Candidatus Dormibacteria bacterium]